MTGNQHWGSKHLSAGTVGGGVTTRTSVLARFTSSTLPLTRGWTGGHPGRSNGQPVHDMLLDSSAAITVVSEEFILREERKGRSIP